MLQFRSVISISQTKPRLFPSSTHERTNSIFPYFKYTTDAKKKKFIAPDQLPDTPFDEQDFLDQLEGDEPYPSDLLMFLKKHIRPMDNSKYPPVVVEIMNEIKEMNAPEFKYFSLCLNKRLEERDARVAKLINDADRKYSEQKEASPPSSS